MTRKHISTARTDFVCNSTATAEKYTLSRPNGIPISNYYNIDHIVSIVVNQRMRRL